MCQESRWGSKCPDTWTTRKALFGVFGRNFETFIVYHTNETLGIQVIEDCIAPTCEECGHEVRPRLTDGEEARVCWPCYAVIVCQLGDMLESVVGDSVWNIMQYLDTTAETDLCILRYTRSVPQTAGRTSTSAKNRHSPLAKPVQLPGPVERSRPPSHTMNSRQLMYWLQRMKRQELVSRIQALDPGFSPEGMTRMMLQATLKHLYAGNYIGLLRTQEKSDAGA